MNSNLTPLEADCLRWDPFAGDKDDGGVRARTVKIVTTRAPHTCLAGDSPHEISVGVRARCERGILDGQWTSWYACLECVEKELDDYYGASWRQGDR